MFASELDRLQGPPSIRDCSWFPANLLLLIYRGLSHPDLQDYSPWSPGEGGRVHQKGAYMGASFSSVCLRPCCFQSDLLRATALGRGSKVSISQASPPPPLLFPPFSSLPYLCLCTPCSPFLPHFSPSSLLFLSPIWCPLDTPELLSLKEVAWD